MERVELLSYTDVVSDRREERLMTISPRIELIAKVLVSICLLGGLFWYVDLEAVMRSLKHADPRFLVLGLLLVIPNVGLQFYRWRYLLRLISPGVTNSDVLTSLFVGFSAGFFTPAQVGEFGGRLANLRELRGSHIIGLSLVDRLYVLALTLLCGGAAISFFCSWYLPEYWSAVYSVAVTIILLIVLLLAFVPSAAKRALALLPEKIRTHRFFGVVEIFETTFHAPQARSLVLQTTAFMFVIVLQYHLFLNAFEPAGFIHSALCAPAILFVKSFFLPISIGDLGVRETTAVFFYSRTGISSAAALNASLCVFAANVLLPSILGAVYILKLKPRSR
jgi:uncharacterized membrane protein YbhN (UPF0104 family)